MRDGEDTALQAATAAVVTAEETKTDATRTAAQDLVTALPDGAAKTALQNRLNAIVTAEDEAAAPDTVITKNGELVDGKASFAWNSVNGIGSEDETVSGSYKYYSNGAYLRFQVKDTTNQVVKFADVFKTINDGNNTIGGMTLQTNEGNINDMDGSFRERADWGVPGLDSYKTRLPNTGNYVFYGLIQNSEYTKTVGFEAGDSRTIKMTLDPRDDLAEGIYTVIVETLQQGSEDVKATFTYTFEVVIPELAITIGGTAVEVVNNIVEVPYVLNSQFDEVVAVFKEAATIEKIKVGITNVESDDETEIIDFLSPRGVNFSKSADNKTITLNSTVAITQDHLNNYGDTIIITYNGGKTLTIKLVPAI